MAFKATNVSPAIIITYVERRIAEKKGRKQFNDIYFQRLLQIGLVWLVAIVAVSQLMASKQQLQNLSFFAVVKARVRLFFYVAHFLTLAQEYLDEAGDVASVVMFALFVHSAISSRACVSELFDSIHPNTDRVKSAQIIPEHLSTIVVVSTIAIASGLFNLAQDPSLASDSYKHVTFPLSCAIWPCTDYANRSYLPAATRPSR